MSKPGNIYVEPREQGDYAVRREGSKRASDVLPTQKAAIERARELERTRSPTLHGCVTRASVAPTSSAKPASRSVRSRLASPGRAEQSKFGRHES